MRIAGCFVLALTQVPTASAHGATVTTGIQPTHGLITSLIGIVLIGSVVVLKRRNRMSPTKALYVGFAGIVVAGLGAVLFSGLSPDPIYKASTIPFPRTFYQPIAMISGLVIIVASFFIGWQRWPTRPRYTFLGIVLGGWLLYPYLIPGPAGDSHPLGYGLVLGTPLLVGYIVWKDAGPVLRSVFQDPVARWFGAGVSIVMVLFFMSVTGYLSFFPEEGVPHRTAIVVLPVIYQLVAWPTLEISIPHIPFFLAVSPGQLIIIGMLSTLIGLNAALIARHWRMQEQAGITQGTAGSVAIVGTCTCGCCGPLVAKLAVLAAGPSIAAPIYWVFVDSASPLSVLFIIGSVVLFTGSLLYSIASADRLTTQRSHTPAEVR